MRPPPRKRRRMEKIVMKLCDYRHRVYSKKNQEQEEHAPLIRKIRSTLSFTLYSLSIFLQLGEFLYLYLYVQDCEPSFPPLCSIKFAYSELFPMFLRVKCVRFIHDSSILQSLVLFLSYIVAANVRHVVFTIAFNI